LADLSVSRTKQAAENSEERAQEVRTRTFKIRSQLKHIHKARVRAGNVAKIERRQVAAERAALTAMQIEDINKARLENAAIAAQLRLEEVVTRASASIAKLQAIAAQRLTDAKQDADSRSQEFSDRVADVKLSLEQINANRLAEGQAQAVRLNDFRSNLTASVWSGSRAIADKPKAIPSVPVVATPKAEKKKAKPEVAKPVIVKAPEPVAIAKPVEVKESVKEIPKAPSKIEQFVVDYVAQLSTNSSLLEVVNDRDTVRDLLAQGANTLKVDPSDILNTLLQMAES
jgi:hypothetical protein